MSWNNGYGMAGRPSGTPWTGADGAAAGPRPLDELPKYARDTTPEHPWPVNLLSRKWHDVIERWPTVWIEGQIVEINARRATSVYITLRDNFEDV